MFGVTVKAFNKNKNIKLFDREVK